MKRLEWLKNKHKELEDKIVELESQRSLVRSAEHKVLLTSLKKEKLAVKDEIATLQIG